MVPHAQRERYWDILKGLLILKVLLGHATGGWEYQRWEYLFPPDSFDYNMWLIQRLSTCVCVAIFFFISAYHTNPNKVLADPAAYYKKRAFRLLVPFYMWSLIYTAVNVAIYNRPFSLVSLLTGTGAIHLYFLAAMFQLVLLTPLLVRFCVKKTGLAVCVLITFLNCLWNVSYWMTAKTLLPNEILLFPSWIAYYAFGIYVRANETEIRAIKMSSILVAFAVTLSLRIAEGYWFFHLTSSPVIPVSVNSPMTILYSFVSIMLLYRLRDCFTFKKQPGILDWIGVNSLGIYIVSWLYEYPLQLATNQYFTAPYTLIIGQVFQVAVTFALSAATVLIVKKLAGSKSWILGM